MHWAEVHDPAIVESDHHLEQEVCVAAGNRLVRMHVMDWAEAQREDPVLGAVLDWLKVTEENRFKSSPGKTSPPAKMAE